MQCPVFWGVFYFCFSKNLLGSSIKSLDVPPCSGGTPKWNIMEHQGIVALHRRHLSLGPCHWGRNPSSMGGPRPMCNTVGVLFPFGCSLSAAPSVLSVDWFSPPELDVYPTRDKALLFLLVARQDL